MTSVLIRDTQKKDTGGGSHSPGTPRTPEAGRGPIPSPSPLPACPGQAPTTLQHLGDRDTKHWAWPLATGPVPKGAALSALKLGLGGGPRVGLPGLCGPGLLSQSLGVPISSQSRAFPGLGRVGPRTRCASPRALAPCGVEVTPPMWGSGARPVLGAQHLGLSGSCSTPSPAAPRAVLGPGPASRRGSWRPVGHCCPQPWGQAWRELKPVPLGVQHHVGDHIRGAELSSLGTCPLCAQGHWNLPG